jgi:hypothetical protein
VFATVLPRGREKPRANGNAASADLARVSHQATWARRLFCRYLHHYATGVPLPACVPFQFRTAILTTTVWFSIELGTSMSPRNWMVTHGSRARVCVSSATQTPSGDHLLLFLSSNLLAMGTAIRRSAVQYSISHRRFRKSHNQRAASAALRLDARSQSLPGKKRQCRAAC